MLTPPPVPARQCRPPRATAALACMVGLAVALGVGASRSRRCCPDARRRLDRPGPAAGSRRRYIGALSCAALPVAPARMVRFGLAATVLLTAAMGVGHLLPAWLAGAFRRRRGQRLDLRVRVAMGLAAARRTARARVGGVIYAGPGVGIVLTGLIGGALAGHRAAPGWLGSRRCRRCCRRRSGARSAARRHRWPQPRR
jgi:hypothetical protein